MIDRKRFLIGQLSKINKESVESEAFVEIIKRRIVMNNSITYKYCIVLMLDKKYTFRQLMTKGILNTTYRRVNAKQWEMNADQNKILIEMERLKKAGFIIDDKIIENLASEFV